MGGSTGRKSPAGPPPAIGQVMRRLAKAIARMELPAIEKISEEQTGDPFQVLIGTMLSAQTRDPVTAAACARLFGVARTPTAISRLSAKQIEALIYPVSFYRHKARHLIGTCRQLIERFGGRVPGDFDELLTLPGVGRKTANLVMIVAHRSDRHICVDTHVHRIANRLGWVHTRTPDETEAALYTVVPERWWAAVNLHLVTWGQNVCRPVFPRCGSCVIRDHCRRVGVVREARA